MTSENNSPEAIEEARKAAERAQQANWFLGGTLFVIATSAGIALTTALNDKSITFIGLAVGVVLFWAVNRFAKK
ncbi:hypothetical protein V5R04_15240 [Jonesiaceae bacterium BS-20]|uniref:Uncharacterized protein n=1 Tax=Jonesiaceae bacterium BS-20 TaxID=3120821 RepID=A0AAU7DW82_9MICO